MRPLSDRRDAFRAGARTNALRTGLMGSAGRARRRSMRPHIAAPRTACMNAQVNLARSADGRRTRAQFVSPASHSQSCRLASAALRPRNAVGVPSQAYDSMYYTIYDDHSGAQSARERRRYTRCGGARQKGYYPATEWPQEELSGTVLPVSPPCEGGARPDPPALTGNEDYHS